VQLEEVLLGAILLPVLLLLPVPLLLLVLVSLLLVFVAEYVVALL
jgi:hypothetical protein